MTFKSTKLAGALFAALTVAAPLALSTTPAQAAPHGMMGGGFHQPDSFHQPDQMHDRNHRPPLRVEYRAHQPRGHFHWRAGQWNWSRNHWVWTQGIWLRF